MGIQEHGVWVCSASDQAICWITRWKKSGQASKTVPREGMPARKTREREAEHFIQELV